MILKLFLRLRGISLLGGLCCQQVEGNLLDPVGTHAFWFGFRWGALSWQSAIQCSQWR